MYARITEARDHWSARNAPDYEPIQPLARLAPAPANDGRKPPFQARVSPRLRLVEPPAKTSKAAQAGLELIFVPSGLFIMGASEGDKEAQEYEKPSHGVVISRNFFLSKYPVTQGLWEIFMGYNPSRFKGAFRPVENVTFDEVQSFLEKINRAETRNFRLPTEAEWEYAARAGAVEPFHFGSDMDSLDKYAWFNLNSTGRTQTVGLKQPNKWGFYDMLGNVWEWVSDWFGDYPASSETNPVGPSEGENKVIRGGAWGSSPWLCRSSTRNAKNPGERSPLIGFRLASEEFTRVTIDEIPELEGHDEDFDENFDEDPDDLD
jgi:formylglycine-generating enzyme required for sulfatase activity